MAITFPTTLDALTNPVSTDPQSSPDHATQHSNENDAIEALEVKVGVDASAVVTSHDYLLSKAKNDVGNYAASVAGTDTYAVTLAPVPTAYTTGMIVTFKADVANTGAATLNVNALGAKSIVKNVSLALNDNDIRANQFVTVVYDGTNFQITNIVDRITNLYADSDGATITFDLSITPKHGVTLGGNRTLAISNATVGQIFLIRLLQDGTGSRTVTWFTTIKWAGGAAPTLTTTANKADEFIFMVTSAGNYDGFVVGQNI